LYQAKNSKQGNRANHCTTVKLTYLSEIHDQNKFLELFQRENAESQTTVD
ncbi:hypothetical protein LOAG_09797, partial [Loa loa]